MRTKPGAKNCNASRDINRCGGVRFFSARVNVNWTRMKRTQEDNMHRPESGYPWSPHAPFQALSLSGGGFRGLFTAQVLAEIEEAAGVPVGRRFDLVCGTSIGALIATAIAFEVPMRRVVDVFATHGTALFPPDQRPSSLMGWAREFWRHRHSPRYSMAPLREVMAALIDPQATLADALHPVAIATVDARTGTPRTFRSPHHADFVSDGGIRVMDAAAGAAAAPTFFEMASVDGSMYVDAGLFATAPDLIALSEIAHRFGVGAESTRMLSVGTTTASYGLPAQLGCNMGYLDWFDDQRLVCLTMAAQQQFADQFLRGQLHDRYYRLDHAPTPDEQTRLGSGIDVSTQAAYQTLVAVAQERARAALASDLQVFLQHKPQLKVMRDM